MAQVGYLEINESNIMVGWHTVAPRSIQDGHSLTGLVTKEDPIGLLGLPDTQIDLEPDKRDVIGTVPEKVLLRNELRTLSIEIDLMERLNEDTTDIQAQFDAKEAIYNSLP